MRYQRQKTLQFVDSEVDLHMYVILSSCVAHFLKRAEVHTKYRRVAVLNRKSQFPDGQATGAIVECLDMFQHASAHTCIGMFKNTHCLCFRPDGGRECVRGKPMPFCKYALMHTHAHTQIRTHKTARVCWLAYTWGPLTHIGPCALCVPLYHLTMRH